MKRATWLLVAVLFLLISTSTLFLFAESDDTDPNPPVQTATPLPPAQVSVDWANIVLPEHSEFSAEMRSFVGQTSELLAPETETESAIISEPQLQITTSNFLTYIVAPGDTIYRIARQFGTPVQSIISLNQLGNPNLIHTGLILKIPAGDELVNPPVESDPVPENGRFYTVKVGDSLYTIARTFATTVNALLQTNQISNPSLIFPGTVLTIPDGATALPPAPQPAPPVPNPPLAEGSTYLVKAGDSLNRIARRFNVSMEALAYVNNISNWAVIYPGQLLTIPGPDVVVPPPTQLPPSASGFIWPVNSRAIVQGYHGGHQAIDIVLPTGSPVLTIAKGTVEFAGWNNHGYGNLVVINHGDGTRSLYAHNSTLLVTQGQQLTQGETIALSGNTGSFVNAPPPFRNHV